MKLVCFECSKEYELDDTATIARSEECPHCGSYTRCCKMCQFYDFNSFNECHEPMAERIAEKTKSNFCNYFRINKGDTIGEQKSEKQTHIDLANSLFKK
jgi:hypothetical protein